jgi:hypothetical protein
MKGVSRSQKQLAKSLRSSAHQATLLTPTAAKTIVVPHMCFPTIVRKQDIEVVRELNFKD